MIEQMVDTSQLYIEMFTCMGTQQVDIFMCRQIVDISKLYIEMSTSIRTVQVNMSICIQMEDISRSGRLDGRHLKPYIEMSPVSELSKQTSLCIDRWQKFLCMVHQMVDICSFTQQYLPVSELNSQTLSHTANLGVNKANHKYFNLKKICVSNLSSFLHALDYNMEKHKT